MTKCDYCGSEYSYGVQTTAGWVCPVCGQLPIVRMTVPFGAPIMSKKVIQHRCSCGRTMKITIEEDDV